MDKGVMWSEEGSSSAMWRGWRGIGSLRESMWECVLLVIQWVGHGSEGGG